MYYICKCVMVVYLCNILMRTTIKAQFTRERPVPGRLAENYITKANQANTPFR